MDEWSCPPEPSVGRALLQSVVLCADQQCFAAAVQWWVDESYAHGASEACVYGVGGTE